MVCQVLDSLSSLFQVCWGAKTGVLNMISFRAFFKQPYNFANLSYLFIAAFLLRALIFGFFVQHEFRYQQADSMDYHNCATCIKYTGGMSFPWGQPIFWRVPGYPVYLTFFYNLFDSGTEFQDAQAAHKAAIWVQLFFCSFIPILIFFLAMSLTSNLLISWLAAWISVIHLGFVLSSTYILSDALALLFIVLFLIFFYKSFRLIGEAKTNDSFRDYLVNASIAALFLAIYAWIRPNGQFTVVVAIILLLFGACAWRQKLIKIAFFAALFYGLIGGWIIRNYIHTGHLFYCPMSGPVLQSFCVPKLFRYETGRSFEECWRAVMTRTTQIIAHEMERIPRENPGMWASRELVCQQLAIPQIMKHPFVFLWEWVKEVGKTTFDLYSSQIVCMVNKSHTYDQLEEFLAEKLKLCLYAQPMSIGLHIIIWLEFLCALLKWIGLFAGCWVFLIRPIFNRFRVSNAIKRMSFLWLKVGFFVGSMLFMTGGFGYARLRLPVEPLLIILSLTFWYWFFVKENNEKTVRAVAR